MVEHRMNQGDDPEVLSQRGPEYKVKQITAQGGMVCVEFMVGSEYGNESITRSEAIKRAKAISDMAKTTKYPDERRELMVMVESFTAAIIKAKEQDGGKYKATSVSMAGANTDPTKSLFSENKKIIDTSNPN